MRGVLATAAMRNILPLHLFFRDALSLRACCSSLLEEIDKYYLARFLILLFPVEENPFPSRVRWCWAGTERAVLRGDVPYVKNGMKGCRDFFASIKLLDFGSNDEEDNTLYGYWDPLGSERFIVCCVIVGVEEEEEEEGQESTTKRVKL